MYFTFNGKYYDVGDTLIVTRFDGLSYKGVLDYVYRKLDEIKLVTEVGDVYFGRSAIVNIVKIEDANIKTSSRILSNWD